MLLRGHPYVELTAAVISFGYVVGVEYLVVIGRSERIRIASAEGEIALEVGFKSDEREASEQLDFTVLAHDRDEVSQTAAFAGAGRGQQRSKVEKTIELTSRCEGQS